MRIQEIIYSNEEEDYDGSAACVNYFCPSGLLFRRDKRVKTDCIPPNEAICKTVSSRNLASKTKC